MAVQVVILSVTGRDPRAREIDELTNCPLYSGPCHWSSPTGEDTFHSSIVIVEAETEEEEALDLACQWIELHSDTVAGVDAEKTIEFQTALLPEEGSRGFAISIDALRVFADAECGILLQYSRPLTDEEKSRRKKR